MPTPGALTCGKMFENGAMPKPLFDLAHGLGGCLEGPCAPVNSSWSRKMGLRLFGIGPVEVSWQSVDRKALEPPVRPLRPRGVDVAVERRPDT